MTRCIAPGVRPGGRPTFLCRQESRQRSDPRPHRPQQSCGFPALLRPCGPAQNSRRYALLKQLRGVRVRPRSELRSRPQGLALLGGAKGGKTNTSRQPASRLGCWLLRGSALEEPRSAGARTACKRHGTEEPPSRSEGRRNRGAFFAYVIAAQKGGRPPGRTPGWASRACQGIGDHRLDPLHRAASSSRRALLSCRSPFSGCLRLRAVI